MDTPRTPDSMDAFLDGVKARNAHRPEFLQAVHEVVETVWDLGQEPRYRDAAILERLVEPDRVVRFRVTWEDDDGGVHVERAWRVQHCGAIGPYKGGLRFHPSVDESTLQFLAFEQTFKNALTGLPMGGGKGGATFDPKGKSDREVRRFCRAMMRELTRYVGADVDVPAGDIGVGAREVGYLFGAFRDLTGRWEGAFTGKHPSYGGSLLRPEATGYGLVYFVERMLSDQDESLEGKTAAVSGSGNVALHAIEKLLDFGAKPVTASDSGGFVHDPEGIDAEKLAFLRELKLERRGRLHEYAERFRGARFHEGRRPWGVGAALALPCATQNELDASDAGALIEGGCQIVAEGANMPTTADAVERLQNARVAFGPGKAANAGGVSVSGLEQSQNAQRLSWTEEDVDARLQQIMHDIHATCAREGKRDDGSIDYVAGANRAGFKRVADALLAQGF
ncbi:MAG: NADP-specific glutamate dehydrogenase [Myxococcota bacterium]